MRGSADEIVINIVGNGATAEFRLDGHSTQEPVSARIGDRVKWINQGNRTHTATTEKVDSEGNPLFDTGDIEAGDSSGFVELTAAMYSAAGGQPGATVDLRYFCVHHDPMASKIVLADGRRASRDPWAGQATTARGDAVMLRRDITTLSSDELTAYRDAWRKAQNSGAYLQIVGRHGCPDHWCHQDSITFLPWHREYTVQMERAIGQPLHYWDWTAASAAASGIPRAFSDSTYISTDGNSYPNPLRAQQVNCDGSFTTHRSPDLPSRLLFIASNVTTAYSASSYRGLNSGLNGPHGSLHLWVGGEMSAFEYAAYDPIFWAHHSNVDRQWASWQRGGGANPSPTDQNASLFGFGGRIKDKLDHLALGYDYDRFDPMPPGGPITFEVAVRGEAASSAGVATGVGRTFEVQSPAPGAGEAGIAPLAIVVKVPEHPTKSYSVYVFANQPTATPEEATPNNPNFAGFFGVFGSGKSAAAAEAHETRKVERVVTLFAGKQPKLREPIKEITLVVAAGDRVVTQEEIPFESIELRRGTPVRGGEERASSETRKGEESFVGNSSKESFDEAYRDAMNQAQRRLGGGMADAMIHAEVVSTKGERGGIGGVRRLTVTIRAWADAAP
jgi:plastocyanin